LNQPKEALEYLLKAVAAWRNDATVYTLGRRYAR